MRIFENIKRLAVIFICLSLICALSCAMPQYLIKTFANTTEEEPSHDIPSPAEEPETESTTDAPSSDEETTTNTLSSSEESTQDTLPSDEPLVDDPPIPAATPSEVNKLPAAWPYTASPSQISQEITWLKDVPDRIILTAGQASDSTWETVLPRQVEAGVSSGDTVWCDIYWPVSHILWDTPGVYYAKADIILPEGYIFGEYVEPYFNAVISIQASGTSQVMDVFTSLGSYGQMGHTWTFAIKEGQDITPLTQTLRGMTSYTGLLDNRNDSIFFTAAWDFSHVDTSRPGLYPIYRHLELVKDSLPADLTAEQVLVPDYWKKLPVLLSVEKQDGPQLYGVLENPAEFFGSYAKLSDSQLNELEVWYSIDKGTWRLQTNEGLMETDTNSYRIHKDMMETGRSYSFLLKLGAYTSRVLTVKKEDTPLIWITWEMGGNRDGTLDIEFPDISQPAPTEPPDKNPGSSTGSSDGNSNIEPGGSGEHNGSQDNGALQDTAANGTAASPTPSASAASAEPSVSIAASASTDPSVSAAASASADPEVPAAASASADPEVPAGSVAHAEKPDTLPANEKESMSLPKAAPDANSVPEEVVTQWTSQISGRRIDKLLELYPEWIRFQKSNVMVLLSSHWLRDQKLKDTDILTVHVSPEEGHPVTILINQLVPEDPPVYRVELAPQEDGYSLSPGILIIITLFGGFAIPLFKRRWRR